MRARALLASWWLLSASLIACFATWYWAANIFAPANTALAQIRHRPIGNNSDLYARWYGTRELLIHGRNPYTDEITREIQVGFYGRVLNPASSEPTAQEAFNYPLYAGFLVAPLAVFPFPLAQQIFRCMALVLIASSIPLWMRALGFRAGPVQIASAMVLTVASYPAVMEFYQQNLAALVIFLMAAAAASASRGWLVLSGCLLALATVKPEITGLVLVWFLLWGVAGWSKRRKFVMGFALSFLCLIFAAEFVLPHWIRQFISAVWKYQSSEADPSLLGVLLPPFAAKLVAVSLIFALLFALWGWRKADPGSDNFGWALAWSSASTLVLLPKLAAYNQLLLIPALLMLPFRKEKVRKAGFLVRSLVKGTYLCQIWQWGAAVVLLMGSVVIPAERLRKLAEVPLYTLLALPAMTLLAVVISTLDRFKKPRSD
jgi:Glycosyltransferase family 87